MGIEITKLCEESIGRPLSFHASGVYYISLTNQVRGPHCKILYAKASKSKS